MTVLRGGAWPAGDGRAVRARSSAPSARRCARCPLDELARILGPATARRRPAPARARRGLERRRRLGRAARRPATPERRQARTLEGILGMLGRLGERRPVVLVLEDLHRADAATRALVTFLARDRRATSAWPIIGSDQPDIVPRDDPWSGRSRPWSAAPRPLERLTLPPLDRDELAALIEGIEGERASASLLLLVAERSGGLPLVAEELLAARRELPTASLTGSLDELVIGRLAVRIARVPTRAAPARPGRAHRSTPAQLAGVGGRLRGRDRAARRRARSAGRAAVTASSTPT